MDVFLFVNRYVLILSSILWAGFSITLGFFLIPLIAKKDIPEIKVLVFNILRTYRRVMYICWILMLGTSLVEYFIIHAISNFENVCQSLIISGLAVFTLHIIWSIYLLSIAKKNEYNPLAMTERDMRILVGGSYFNNFLIISIILIYAIVEMMFHL
ncbi:hypothetical protein [Kosmotoga pacifica]|uniref:DUF4149 domain-containing protein n=1 Tax=Kosmotoga pacifica TaxID=1330330 RepID=A0A0G2Z7M0_9BACT|nr:hypothetical protein [Kosmotoga pacifica]AKI97542.1 hypothetical protein IX53_06625 [Kosmotoga pacifica]